MLYNVEKAGFDSFEEGAVPDKADMGRKPLARMFVTNLRTNDTVTAQFNPTELNESIAVSYARLAVLGLSHQPLQYQYTENQKEDFELYWSAFDDVANRIEEIDYARRFFLSLCVPSRGAGDVIGGAPPRVHFFWPQIMSLTCVVTSLKIKHTAFNIQSRPVRFTIAVSLEEIRDRRLFSEDVLELGTQSRANGESR